MYYLEYATVKSSSVAARYLPDSSTFFTCEESPTFISVFKGSYSSVFGLDYNFVEISPSGIKCLDLRPVDEDYVVVMAYYDLQIFIFKVGFTATSTITDVKYFEAFDELANSSFFFGVRSNYQEDSTIFSHGYIIGSAFGKDYAFK